MKKITKESRNIVLAMALGDGYLSSSGILSIRHAVIQKEYLEWKKSILNQWGINTTELYYVDNNGYGAYELRTYTNEFIKVMRRRLYKPSKKISQFDV